MKKAAFHSGVNTLCGTQAVDNSLKSDVENEFSNPLP